MFSFLKIILFTIGGAALTGLAGYICGAAFGLLMTWENNRNPELPRGNYWWANFVGIILLTYAWLPGAVIGLLRGIAVQLENKAKANN